ncbi:MAG: hypothetical protein ACI9SY_000741, partial [Candidatus Paceibacteria bacterium]
VLAVFIVQLVRLISPQLVSLELFTSRSLRVTV